MKPLQPLNLSEQGRQGEAISPNKAQKPLGFYVLAIVLGLAGWLFVYLQLGQFADFIVFKLLSLSNKSHLGQALRFFIYDTPKVLLLMTLVIFGVGILRTFLTPERTRKFLAGKKEFVGNILAALLGILTPFCTCSAIPLFVGFVTAGIPLGVTFSFLIASPMINEIALVLLYGLVGWKVAMLYLITGLMIAIGCGWILGKLGLEKYIEDWVRQIRTNPELVVEERKSWPERIEYGLKTVKEIVGKIWLYVCLGIAVGAIIHGYVPQSLMASIMGKSAWWSVPLSVLIGIPMYSNGAGIVPVVEALLGKGASLGTVLAFMMSVIALSLPEMLILRKVLKPRLIAIFITIVGSGILLVGYLFNFLF